ncbi:LOW QUALITY PROTEIN: ATP-dependent DNA helicase Q4 [Camarhynchus parvulus]|uniref:LOW QUALITY PROTEIN: ATP-dependent DNA helicase Q4 n=1 Tax=Geospiza parvula TaxID=87175 RepID=UPI0012382835|nr:LOW QUALITY PROTEIN: ATP-dependent DNA helicase Q4 [Camarhynchus parvulus]
MERQQELKVLLKRWEAEFLRERLRKPSQADIEEAPAETRKLSLPPSLKKNPQNSPEFPDQNPNFFPIPGKFQRLQRSVAQTLASLDPAWIQRCEESQKTWEFSGPAAEVLGNVGRKRPRDGDGDVEAPAKVGRESKPGIPELRENPEKEKEKEKEEGKIPKRIRRILEEEEEEEEEEPKTTRRARAPARGNFVRLNLKRKSYSRASMRGKFLRKQVWKQKWRKKFGGALGLGVPREGFGIVPRGSSAGEAAPHSGGSGPKNQWRFYPRNSRWLQPREFPARLGFPGIPSEFSGIFPPPPMDPLYPPNPDGTVPDPPEEVLEALRTLGFDSFRPGQAEAVMRVLSGISTLLLLPTGSGKSLCYQLPAFLYHRRSPCISIVISPLVSLMDDQVSGLPSALKAVCIHSNLTPSQRSSVSHQVRSGRAQILLLSPESVTGSEFFSRLFRHFPPVAFACLDEAHCISQWSHNFRPAYLRVCKVLRERLGVRCFLGLTATATVATARDVAEHLGIPEGNSTVGTFGIPENLRLSVSLEADPDQGVLRVLREWSRENFGNCGDFGNSVIVYCTRREESERLAALIHNEFPEVPGTKTLKGVLCATACVGLGIHCGRVRAVLLHGGTACAESFLQHVGRAGRDGQPARGHLCLHSGGEDFLELRRRIHENSVDFWAVKALVQRVFAPCQCPEIAGQNPENSQLASETLGAALCVRRASARFGDTRSRSVWSARLGSLRRHSEPLGAFSAARRGSLRAGKRRRLTLNSPSSGLSCCRVPRAARPSHGHDRERGRGQELIRL